MSELCCSGQNFGVWLGHFCSNSEINIIILITGFVFLHNDPPPPHPPPPKKKKHTPSSNTKLTELSIVKRNDHMHNMTNNTGMQISTLVMKKSASLGLITRTTNTCQYSQRQHAFQWQSCLMQLSHTVVIRGVPVHCWQQRLGSCLHHLKYTCKHSK